MEESYYDIMKQNMKFYTPTAEELKLWTAPKDELVKLYTDLAGDLGVKAVKIVEKYNK